MRDCQFGILVLFQTIHYCIRKGVLRNGFLLSDEIMLLLCKDTLLLRVRIDIMHTSFTLATFDYVFVLLLEFLFIINVVFRYPKE